MTAMDLFTWLLVIIESRVVSRAGGPGGQILTGHCEGGGHAPHPHHVPHVRPVGQQGAQLSTPAGPTGTVSNIPVSKLGHLHLVEIRKIVTFSIKKTQEL